jgi:hypothetical protein
MREFAWLNESETKRAGRSLRGHWRTLKDFIENNPRSWRLKLYAVRVNTPPYEKSTAAIGAGDANGSG